MIAFPERFDVDEQAFYQLIDRCAAGEPISRIRGTKEFYGRDFYISPAVLDPRPESETLIDVAKAEFSKDAALNILEIGVGSGALICTLLLEFPRAKAVGTDISADALAIAQRNIDAHKLTDKAQLECANLFPTTMQAACFDLVISNPPYIETAAIAALEASVKHYDPALALDGGADGFDCYRNIAAGIAPHLNKDAAIIMEIGQGMADKIIAIMRDHGFQHQATTDDLAAIPRALSFQQSS